MTLDTRDWGVTTADDTFHAVDPDERMWTETIWFSWHIPERKLFGNFYPVFRPNVGVLFGGIGVYDDKGTTPFDCPVWDQQWHLPIPENLDLRDCELPNTMRVKAIEPNQVFEFSYDGDEIRLDLRFEALMRPLVSGGESDLFNKGGHLDQPGHVTGTMTLHGDVMQVDCLAQRDRAWGPRRDNRQPRIAYVYGTASADNAFLAISAQKRGAPVDAIFGGYLMRDGTWAKMVSGAREVERNDEGIVTQVRIDGEDELGRRIVTEGEVVSRLQTPQYPSLVCINGLTRFDLDGEEGWGEDQDTWSHRRWRDFQRSLKES